MLEQISPLWPILKQKQQANEPLVMVTLVKATGSSYKKPGAMMLIEADGSTHGLISGGCLEADVAEHAKSVFENHQAISLTYDMSDDSIFGLGAGCDGTLVLVLQLLKGDYLPLSAMSPLPNEAQACQLFINHLAQPGYSVGEFALTKTKQIFESETGILNKLNDTVLPLHYLPPPKVTICGAGIDIYPLVKILKILQWHIEVIDHRSGRLQAAALKQVETSAAYLPDIDTSKHKSDAVIIMTHNIDHDAAYLKSFAHTGTSWLGLLGPVARRNKVLKKADIMFKELSAKLHAPVGLDIGGHSPETIAISIVAQLQQYFSQR